MRDLIDHRLLLRAAAFASAPALVVAAIALLATPEAQSAPAADAQPIDAPKLDVAADVRDGGADARPDGRVDVYFPDIQKPDVRPIPPDPTPLVTDAAFVLNVKYDKGNVTIEKVKRIVLPKKEALPRHMGRFAAELYVGPTLVERLRFDFPLISNDDVIGESYAKGMVTSVEVKIPDSDRPTRLEIWDRATDKRWIFPYPPKLTP